MSCVRPSKIAALLLLILNVVVYAVEIKDPSEVAYADALELNKATTEYNLPPLRPANAGCDTYRVSLVGGFSGFSAAVAEVDRKEKTASLRVVDTIVGWTVTAWKELPFAEVVALIHGVPRAWVKENFGVRPYPKGPMTRVWFVYEEWVDGVYYGSVVQVAHDEDHGRYLPLFQFVERAGSLVGVDSLRKKIQSKP
jgi:hypothetical protein